MGPIRIVHPRLLMAGLLMLAGFGALATGAAAQTTEDPESTTLTAFVRLCLEPGCTEDLALAEPVDGVLLEVTDSATGDVLGSCATGDLEPGACAVEIPAVESVDITLDTATLPEGYEPDANPGVLMLADSQEYPFLLFPEGGFPEDEAPAEQVGATPEADQAAVAAEDDTGDTDDADEVSALPETGTGTGADSTVTMVTASTLAVAALGLAALGVRRLVGRSEA